MYLELIDNLMSKPVNYIALFCSHDNVGRGMTCDVSDVKYIDLDQNLDWIKINSFNDWMKLMIRAFEISFQIQVFGLERILSPRSNC